MASICDNGKSYTVRFTESNNYKFSRGNRDKVLKFKKKLFYLLELKFEKFSVTNRAWVEDTLLKKLSWKWHYDRDKGTYLTQRFRRKKRKNQKI